MMSQQQLKRLVRYFESHPYNPDQTVEEARRDFEQLGVSPLPAYIHAEPADAGGIKAEWLTTSEVDGGRAILYLHGGSYVMGGISTHRELAGRIARSARARVLLIDYRLAPEHPFPAALEDSLAAYRWMLANGVNPLRLVIVGDSAGGGLTVATLVAIKEARLAMPAAAVCLSPWVDLELTGASMTTKAAVDHLVRKEELAGHAKRYLAGKDPRTPLASPLYADLAGLPPMLIQVGTAETLLDDANRLAERARSAGVNVTLDIGEDMIHVWSSFASMLEEGQHAIDRIGEFVRAHTTR
jgi:acetyl esterase/lipase